MDKEKYSQGLIELYQGEILGEVLFNEMLSIYEEPDHQYKISVMLQLETETKARLRPAMVDMGLDLREQQESRKMGMDMAAAMKGKPWQETMQMILDAVKPVVEHYREIAASLPEKYSELGQSMVIHEQAIVDFAELELAGKQNISIDGITAQLHNKLPCES